MRVVTLAFRDGTVLRRCTTPHPHIPPPHPRAPAPAPHQHATLYRGVKPTLYWNTSSQSEEPCWTLTLTLIRRIRAGRSQTKKGASAVRPRLGWRRLVAPSGCVIAPGHSHAHSMEPPSHPPAIPHSPPILICSHPPPPTHTHSSQEAVLEAARSTKEGASAVRPRLG